MASRVELMNITYLMILVLRVDGQNSDGDIPNALQNQNGGMKINAKRELKQMYIQTLNK